MTDGSASGGDWKLAPWAGMSSMICFGTKSNRIRYGMHSPYLILAIQERHNGACRAVFAILAPIKKPSERPVGVLSTDVQVVEQSVNVARVGEENVAVILTKPLIVDACDWGRAVAGISRTCRGGTAEQTKAHTQVYSPMTTNFSGSDSSSRSGFLNPSTLVTYCTV